MLMRRLLLIAMALGLAGCQGSTPVPEGGGPQIEIVTNMGKIRCELFEREAPITVKNFLQYVDEKHYDGTIFHRVISNFMIQGGGFDIYFKERPTHGKIKNESYNGVENRRGTLAMARTNDPNSATAQFFINVKDNDFLDKAKAQDGHGYAVFGRVIDGMTVVDDIRRQRTKNDPMPDVPENMILIESIRRVQ
jgi:peptidyl-prolyl cis-trans isomerase B (cyclophilin B)